MMVPARWRCMAGITARAHNQVPSRLMRITLSQSCGEVLVTVPPHDQPAAVTRMSMRPQASRIARASASAFATSETRTIDLSI